MQAWSPGLDDAVSLLGKTGTVVSLDSAPHWPVFLTHGAEDGVEVGPTTYCFKAGWCHGRWTVVGIDYRKIVFSRHLSGSYPFALILEEAV